LAKSAQVGQLILIRVVYGFCLALLASTAMAAADEPGSEAYRYALSMSGALISDNCERNWQAAEYISVYACNYGLAQLYNLEISALHFAQCAEFSRGDIVKIAECMTDQFNVWLASQQQSPNVTIQ
jgi:ribosomal protein S17